MGQEVKLIRRLLPLLKLYPWAIPAIVLLGLLSSLFEGLGISLFIPFLQSFNPGAPTLNNNSLGSFLNQLVGLIPSDQRLWIIPWLIFSSILLKNGLTYCNSVLASWLNNHITHRLRSQIFQQLLTVSYRFLETHPTGQLLNTLNTETWRTSYALSALVGLIINISTVLVFTALLILISWKLTLLVAIAMGSISLCIQWLTQRVRGLGQQATDANSTLSQQMVEGLSGMRVIRAFGRQSYEQQRFDRASEQVRVTFFQLDLLSGMVGPVSEVLSAALLVAILLVGLQNRAALPILLTFVLILYRLQPQVKKLDGSRIGLITVAASVDTVLSLLSRTDKPYIQSGSLPFLGLKQAIAFEGVTFHYGELNQPALNQVSLQIPQGKTTALVGPSGAGKSTLINLLCRFYEVTQGEIYVDGCPLRQLDLASWREAIAIVSQDVHMFNARVRDNIAYGKLEASEQDIIHAAKQANAHDFILQLPQGYDTPLGDRGLRLSGGQRQRLALARALIRNPQILILDEATNALDSISETLVQEALSTFSRDRTVIIVAHRLATIEQADQIIVLEQGQVREQGSLGELLQHNGLFAKLYRLQHRNANV